MNTKSINLKLLLVIIANYQYFQKYFFSVKLLKKTLSERFIFADRGRRKSHFSLVNESLYKTPPDFTSKFLTYLKIVWLDKKN